MFMNAKNPIFNEKPKSITILDLHYASFSIKSPQPGRKGPRKTMHERISKHVNNNKAEI